MTTQSIALPQQTTVKSSYNVLLEYPAAGRVSAMVLGWPDCTVEAATKAEALEQLQTLLTEQLRDREIVSLEIEVPLPEPEHPWLKFAGQFFADDQEYEEFMAFIEEDRRQLDLEMEEYYKQIDAQETQE